MECAFVVTSFWHSSNLDINEFSYKSEYTSTKVMDAG